MAAADWIEHNIAPRAFLTGLGGVVLVIGGLAAYAWLNGDRALTRLATTMPGQTVDIDWPAPTPAQPVIPENHIAIDIPVPDETAQIATEEDPAAEESSTPEPAVEKPQQTAIAPATPLHEVTPGVPIEGLLENTAQGRLPIIRQSDNLTPFQAYRRPFDREAAHGKPVISLAVFDLGLSASATTEALETLPPETSLVFSPYMDTPGEWVTRARTRGHEVWLTLPVEVSNYPLADTGPHTALIGAAERDNLGKLYWVMAQATNYVGFVTPPDPAFIKAEQDMRPLLTRIYGRGLGFVDGSLMPSLIPQTMAKSARAPYSTVDIWADSAAEPHSIADALAQAEKLAREQGFAAVVIRPYPLSYKMVREWIGTLPGKGIILAPLSAQTGM